MAPTVITRCGKVDQLLTSTKMFIAHTDSDYTCFQVLIPDTMVSRRHAVVSFRNGRYYLKDLGSSNGTLVNDARVALDDEVEVGHGTVVQVK